MAGRKRKIGSLTSHDYADQLHQLEQHLQNHAEAGAQITHQQKEAAKKKKRSLKNRMSALKSREKQRAKFQYLEQEVKRLRQRIDILKEENQDLQKAYRSGLIAEHKYAIRRQQRTICPVSTPTENISSKNNSFSMPSVPWSASLTSAFFHAQKNSTLVNPCTRNSPSAVSTVHNIHPLNVTALNFDAQKNSTGVKPCAHNYRSAVSRARNSHPLNGTALNFDAQNNSMGAKPCTHNYSSAVSTTRSKHPLNVNTLHSTQYSHLLRGMPWESFRSIFMMLLECTKNFVASKTSKEILASQITYSQAKDSLMQLFWKTLVSTGYENHFVGVPGNTAQKRACVIFDNICDNIYETILERVGMVSEQRVGVEY